MTISLYALLSYTWSDRPSFLPFLSFPGPFQTLETRIHDPPQGEALRKSAIVTPPPDRIFVVCMSLEFRPSDRDAGILLCGLRRPDGLGFEKEVDLRPDMTPLRPETA